MRFDPQCRFFKKIINVNQVHQAAIYKKILSILFTRRSILTSDLKIGKRGLFLWQSILVHIISQTNLRADMP